MKAAIANRWIWPFELQEKIGDGGMGVVYRARYVKNDRQVAVKLLPANISADEMIYSRFKREMETLKTLKHPNIVHCFGGVCEDAQQFYAMELVEGGTLQDLLSKSGSLPWERVIEYGLQICSALAFAHEKGVIHRDIKPANFLMTKTGQLKLADFGIMLVAGEPKLTSDGMTVGSYHYMAPEQIRGGEITPQTDLYAFGCVLFELLSGHPPFEGNGPAQLLHQHLKVVPPRVATIALDCPAMLDNLIASLLEKDPADRPPGALEVGQSLNQITQSTKAGTLPHLKQLVTQPHDEVRDSADTVSVLRSPLVLALGLLVLLVISVNWSLSETGTSGTLQRSRELWREAYHHEDVEVRAVAARALAEIGHPVDDVVEELMAGLESTEPQVRAASVQALGEIGSSAKSAVPTLMRMQKFDSSQPVRFQTAVALNRIQQDRAIPGGSSFWLFLWNVLLFLGTMYAFYRAWKSTASFKRFRRTLFGG